MKKRRILRYAAALLTIPVLCLAHYSWFRIRGEHFYLGRPSSYWSREIKEWQIKDLQQRGSWVAPWQDRMLNRLGVLKGDVSHPAIFAAGGSGTSVLVDLLKDEDVGVRYGVSGYVSSWHMLAECGLARPTRADCDEIMRALLQALRDQGPFDRRPIIFALGHLGSDLPVPALIEELGAEEASARSAAAEALGNIGASAQPAIRALGNAIRDNHASVRVAAALALWQISEETELGVPALAQVLLDREDADLAASAARALKQIGPKASPAIPALITALKSNSESVRQGAAAALGRVGPTGSEAVEALIETLKDENLATRRIAIDSLGRIGPKAKAARAALMEIARREDPDLQEDVSEALASIGSGDEGK